MKVLLSWLRELAELPDSVDAIEVALNSLGLAVDGVEHINTPVAGVVTARIERIEKHPDADKVTRTWVTTGDGEPKHVWCGAKNFNVGDTVALATLGTKMPNGMEISRRGILGIDSEGMLCSGVELGIEDDADGIVILPTSTPLGVDAFVAMGLHPDVVFELDLTRNRPDCWGHVGVARDLAAHFGTAIRSGSVDIDSVINGPEKTVAVAIIDGARCGRFASIVISGLQVKPSPQSHANKLTAVGMRPINNIVDVSNLVMLETNQPNHAYDLRSVQGFRIREAKHGEVLATLDGVERKLDTSDLLICDQNDSPIGIAGIMGGLESEVRLDTTEIALEVAWFEPEGIAASVQRLGLRSEASARFERGTDPYGIAQSVVRFVELLRETCPNLVVHSGVTDSFAESLPVATQISLRVPQVERLLGTAFTKEQITDLLTPIGFMVSGDKELLDVVVPTWRPDCTLEVDLIEEIARHFGYDNLGKSVPKSAVHGGLSILQQRRRALHEVVLGLGASEAMPNPFLAQGDLEAAGLNSKDALHLANPLVAEESVLRTSLIPGLLRSVSYNENHRVADIALFEIGHVYPRDLSTTNGLPAESEMLAIIAAEKDATAAMSWWNEVAAALGVGAQIDQLTVPDAMHPTRSATLRRGKEVIGAVGEIDPLVLRRFNIASRVAYLEVNLSAVLGSEPKPAQAKVVSRFPSSDIDLAFVLDSSQPAANVMRALRQAGGALVADIALFDVYRGPGVDDSARSLTFRLRLQAPDRTLTDIEIAGVREKCIAAVEKAGGTLRA